MEKSQTANMIFGRLEILPEAIEGKKTSLGLIQLQLEQIEAKISTWESAELIKIYRSVDIEGKKTFTNEKTRAAELARRKNLYLGELLNQRKELVREIKDIEHSLDFLVNRFRGTRKQADLLCKYSIEETENDEKAY